MNFVMLARVLPRRSLASLLLLTGLLIAAPRHVDAGLGVGLGDPLARATTTLRAAKGERTPFVYRVELAEPQRHEFQLSLRFADLAGAHVDLQMPKWNPGAYRLTHAHRNVRAAVARPLDAKGRPIAGETLPVHKLDEITWRVEHGGRPFALDYRVWCGSYTGIGGCFLDDTLGFFNGATLFMAAKGHETRPITLEVDNLPDLPNAEIVTGLPPAKGSKPRPGQPSRLWAANFDVLIDGPVHVGEVEWIRFELGGKSIRAAMGGSPGPLDPALVEQGLLDITREAAEVFGSLAEPDAVLPFTEYTFIYQRLPANRGGLEHANSTVIGLDPFDLDDPQGLEKFWSVSAHEFFHLWNVKRIRPALLGPFDYSKEVHTTMLWFSEGFTSYYGWLIRCRAGLLDEKARLAELDRRISAFELVPARKLLSVEQSSWETWATPDDPQAYFSYYDKGMMIGVLLDLHLRHASKGSVSLDTVMQALWQRFRSDGLGLTPAQLEQVIVDALPPGEGRDETARMFADYVHGVAELDYDRYLGYAGYRLDRREKDVGPWLGAKLESRSGKLEIVAVEHDSPADRAGLGTGDRLVAISGHAIAKLDEWQQARAGLPIGKPATITVERRGRVVEREVVAIERGDLDLEVVTLDSLTPEQSLLRREWLEG